MDPSSALRWTLAALALLTAGYHLGHAAVTVRDHRSRYRPRLDVDLIHGAMGSAMAVMFVGRLDHPATFSFLALFGVGTLWFLVPTPSAATSSWTVRGDRTRQSVCCVVMTGMLAVSLLGPAASGSASSGLGGMAGMGGMGGMGGMADRAGSGTSGPPLNPGVLLAALLVVQVVVVAWTAQTAQAARVAGGSTPPAVRANPAHRYSQLATSVTGACMLALML